MVELKSKNLFVKSGIKSSDYTIAKILEFYDLIGLNVLYMSYKNGIRDGLLINFINSTKRVFTSSNFEDVLKDNLFRVDIVFIDGSTMNYNLLYNLARKITSVPIIFLSTESELKQDIVKIRLKDFDTAYLLTRDVGIPTGKLTSISSLASKGLDSYIVEELKGGWKSNLKELKIQYIRDKNLTDLLGDTE